MQNINSVATNILRPLEQKNIQSPNTQSQVKFSDFLKKSIEDVNQSQIDSDILTKKMANGENVDLHQVMITAQKASITLQAALEIRNKVVEAYQETMRMQV
ncbi:flagellar hook-basal body complex protein FliE [Heyndrickxia sporothermodurans]|nr:flagellar hook-basal body complex protein FliE [Heyndrickxia sporothermodurans]PTY79933.1 flagellar hook-basal body complex protein FliE [Heyndrickxia sporothermodurans]PTY81587.1 flagellar hook-basal body complex protein FliE [Heyndrickxia sporothermodurans]PTY83783.1 flagellar hook-basal body complex protein FliE [Heyndrickxia sporothermodurans]